MNWSNPTELQKWQVLAVFLVVFLGAMVFIASESIRDAVIFRTYKPVWAALDRGEVRLVYSNWTCYPSLFGVGIGGGWAWESKKD